MILHIFFHSLNFANYNLVITFEIAGVTITILRIIK